jgi:hypothetical protein
LTSNTSAWYCPTSLLMAFLMVALLCWVFRQAIAGQTLLKAEL